MYNKCKKCGKTIIEDFSNPNVHYSGGLDICITCTNEDSINLPKQESKYCPQCGKSLNNGEIYYEMCDSCKHSWYRQRQMIDKNGELIEEGDTLLSDDGYYVKVIKDGNEYCGRLICDENHSCKNVDYSINNGIGHLKVDISKYTCIYEELPPSKVDLEVLDSEGNINHVYRCGCSPTCREWRCSTSGYGICIKVIWWRKYEK